MEKIDSERVERDVPVWHADILGRIELEPHKKWMAANKDPI